MVDLTPLQGGLLVDLTRELPPAIRLQRLVACLRAEFACSAVVVLRLDGESLRPQAAVGLADEALGRSFSLAHHPRLAQILAQREPVQFSADSEHPDPYDGLLEDNPDEPLPVHDCMGMGLYLEGNLWGAVTFDALVPGHFNSQARQRLQGYAWIIETSLRISRLEGEVRSLRLARREQVERGDEVQSMILGSSPVLLELLDELGVVAGSDLPVLLQGETGVGKELFARWLHAHSPRARKPLVYVNCAALPEALAESELFGHTRGAFSGAGQDRPGRFEAANGGTLFLDEIGELPLSIQAKLLRALQNGEIQRLGADQPRHVDVRVIAATNRRLWEEVREGRFRIDLYHRLSVYPVHIPPLRERGRDVLVLAGHFLELNRTRLGLRCLRLSSAAERALLNYEWPGNVRELEHVISRAALKVLSHAQSRTALLSIEEPWLGLDSAPAAEPKQSPVQLVPARGEAMHIAMEHFQRELINATLTRCQGKLAAAARTLQMDPSNLRKLARRFNLI
jgi:anaerobic nitric oxide reductase transcription regulator